MNDKKQLQIRIKQLIEEGERLVAVKCTPSSQQAVEWFEKVNILNERHLKTHPSYSAIFSEYFHSKNRSDSISNMVSRLRAVIQDEDFFGISDNNEDWVEDTIGTSTIDKRNSPDVFISYSWDSDEHKSWVKELADTLLSEGVAVKIDQYDLLPGERLTTFMEKSITECDKVLIICTPKYKEKADDRLAGVGYESNIITADILQKHNDLKYIPVVRSGDFDSSMPTYMLGKLAVDLRENNKSYADSFQDLLASIKGKKKKPSISNKISNTSENIISANNSNSLPLHIIGIITDEVTLPRNDGTRGSALYSIPFRLSGFPSPEWSEYFIHSWNYPSSFTTMHRPGIASVRGDKIILNGTTIEEVQNYHRKTLIEAVKKANELYDQYNQRIIQEQGRKRKFEEEHNKKIKDIASNIDFNE